MEAMEEEVAPQPSSPPTQPSHNGAQDLCLIAKGKRTKRYRPHSPIPLVIAPLTIVAEQNNKIDQSDNILSPAIASSEESTTTEDIETAQCLMLLAQGRFSSNLPPNHNNNNNNSNKRQIQDTGGTPCVYTCKTCDRSFSSFQALGGHRASHKKPKNEKKRSMFFSDEEDYPSPLRTSSNSLSLQLSNISSTTFSLTPKSSPSPRFHVCSYCGADFTSGQALGGHMRKHRSVIISNNGNNRSSSNVVTTRNVPVEERCDESERMRNALSLDLNLPAPEDEVHQRFGFVARQEDELRSDHEINDDTTKTALVLATITPDHTTTTPIVALLN